MDEIILNESDDLVSIIEKIKNAESLNLRISISEDSPLKGNILNIKILKKEAEKLGKNVEFSGINVDEEGSVETLVEGDILKDTPPSKVDGEERLSFVDKFVDSVRGRFHKIFPRGEKKSIYVLVGISAVTAISVLAALFWFLPSSRVSLVVNSEVLVKSVGVLLVPDSVETDSEGKNVLSSILIEIIETKIQGTKATGKKKVGDKAKGTVTVRNWTDNEKSLSQGDKITSVERIDGERLSFFLDSEATVPARTATVSSTPDSKTTTYKPGTTEVEVTAEEVGESHNLADETLFTLGDSSLDDFEVIAETVLSGGSSREVTVVTKEDQDKLTKALLEVLKEKGKEDLESKLVGDQKLHRGTIKYDVLSEKYSREVDDEAEEFSVTLEIKASALVYSEAELNDLLGGLLADFVPEGFEISDRDKEVKVDVLKALDESGTSEIQIKVRSYVLPEIDPDFVKRGLTGLKVSSAQSFLASVPNLESYQINLWPPLPSFLQTMPRSTSRIEIEVVRK